MTTAVTKPLPHCPHCGWVEPTVTTGNGKTQCCSEVICNGEEPTGRYTAKNGTEYTACCQGMAEIFSSEALDDVIRQEIAEERAAKLRQKRMTVIEQGDSFVGTVQPAGTLTTRATRATRPLKSAPTFPFKVGDKAKLAPSYSWKPGTEVTIEAIDGSHVTISTPLWPQGSFRVRGNNVVQLESIDQPTTVEGDPTPGSTDLDLVHEEA